MSANTFPAQIEPFKWAEQGFSWSGTLPLTRFPRIAQEVVPPLDDLSVDLSCRLSEDDRGTAWLNAQLVATLPLVCQRCLDKVDIEVNTNVHLAILDDPARADRLMEDADYIVISEEQVVHAAENSDTIDLLALIEDELLLALPTSPRHEQCEMAVKPVEADEPVRQANPFGILAGLKLDSDVKN
jgi:uncharacterized protein